MFKFFKPAPAIDRLPEERIDAEYKKLRFQVFMGIFIGYAAYYLIRKNFSIAMPFLIEEEGWTKTQLGFALSALAIAYGISKFLMATISDRSNPRIFMTVGLVLSAIINLLMGFVPYFTSGVTIMFIMIFLNGWVQGMGWPPAGRSLVHWYSISERGNKTAIWNVSHNVGGGLMAPVALAGVAVFAGMSGFSNTGYEGVFIVPALVALVCAVVMYFLIRDTPQSVGLPPIEEYRNDYPSKDKQSFEQELSVKDILFKYVLNNKWVWAIAFANIFVYFVRYGVLDWAPTYLSEEKDFNVKEAGLAYFLYEWAGIPGTLLCGWLSDKLFKGRRGPAGFVFMVGVLVAVLIYWFNPAGNPMIDMICLVAIGFLIYGPVMLIGLQALDFVPKKAAGTAAGLTGFFGYIFGTLTANALMGFVVDAGGWDAGFMLLAGSCVLAALIFALTWNVRGQEVVKKYS
ncbi:glycerol-3-phosphate transporter [Priestia taiwanensis]|uniref:Glycerol-3-phosphate transporter n=1 Tax=Priestia taiwanensis TaxID=1347902 RepID=A0A917AY06_9BACI|nr:glycerol-3-phosphate transporter [Priestia taiwanensis]MBM7364876.1 OPA family glycerol-3-phosphate transporter-like MFS transporter [Priestia taiwanensis]GGE82977.1 glycerol-3-phosphate transporter [Priestia taiwanensis]